MVYSIYRTLSFWSALQKKKVDRMANIRIDWNSFKNSSDDEHNIPYRFEDLCRQIFSKKLLSNTSYLHCNPNNPGIESEPIYDEKHHGYVGFQCKYFENNVDYKQIKDSLEKAAKHYSGKLDYIYLFCNKNLTTSCKSFKEIEGILKEAGISLKLITNNAILDSVRKDEDLGYYYFGHHNITHEWFSKKAKIAESRLGGRYNQIFNVDTVTSKHLSIFFQDQNALDYFNSKKKQLKEELQSMYWGEESWCSKAQRLLDFLVSIPDISYSDINTIEEWNDTIKTKFKDDIVEIESEIKNRETRLLEDDSNQKRFYLDEKSQLQSLLECYSKLKLTDDERKLLNSKILIVKGSAGIGKTQLFANEVFSILNQNENALIILGGSFTSDAKMLNQIREDLEFSDSFENLICILEQIGKERGRIIPILIDALNESWNPDLWKDTLSELFVLLSEKKYVRLAISFRSEYEKTILPEDFTKKDGVISIIHTGFRDNSFEATKTFLQHYNIPFTSLEFLSSGMDNPLFLTLFCKTYDGNLVGLNDLYDRLLEKANDSLFNSQKNYLRNCGYTNSENLVELVINAFSKELLSEGKFLLEKSKVLDLYVWKGYGLNPQPFINHLIKEGIFHDIVLENSIYIRFSFDQMNDFYLAKAAVSMCSSAKELRAYIVDNVLGIIDGEVTLYNRGGLFASICALYAEKYHSECIDVIDQIKSEYVKRELYGTFLNSLEWRDNIYLSLKDILGNCNKYQIQYDVEWNAFVANSIKPSHILNADSLHKVLMNYSLAKRDYLWTITINSMSSEYDRVIQLVELYNKGEILDLGDKEQVRLLLILFSWMLSSSNRKIRDITSKAMIEILKEHFEFVEYILDLFKDVNDPYIIQRLYGIAFGACTKRTDQNKGVFKSLVCFIYKNVFSNEYVYPDILLRDYARLTIDYFISEYPSEYLDFDLSKIVPPYKSKPIPDSVDKDYTKEHFGKGLSHTRHSMMFEGIEGMYGDFGRYVFQRALRYFDVDKILVFNYAMDFIINELKYEDKLFEQYDVDYLGYQYSRVQSNRIERIGKKYQWIAMYNILARISDSYPMLDGLKIDGAFKYISPIEPNVRDFDPTLNDNFTFNRDAPLFQQAEEHFKEAVSENNNIKLDSDFSYKDWLSSGSVFYDLQVEDLLLEDQNKEQWVSLLKIADTGKMHLVHDKLLVWNCIYGYFVSEEQLWKMRGNAEKDTGVFIRDIRAPSTYVIYNREYPWSSACKETINDQRLNAYIETGEYFTLKSFGERKTVGADIMRNSSQMKFIDAKKNDQLGEIVCAAQKLLWEEEFDESKEDSISFYIPCSLLINSLNLKQKIYDGYYYDQEDRLVSFDTELNNQKAGLVIRKSYLDRFLKDNKLHLVWLVSAGKQVFGVSTIRPSYLDLCGFLEYTGESVVGKYFIPKTVE